VAVAVAQYVVVLLLQVEQEELAVMVVICQIQ
jgi:hypothetical protein